MSTTVPGRSRCTYLLLGCISVVAVFAAVAASARSGIPKPDGVQERGLLQRVADLEVELTPPVGAIIPFVGDPTKLPKNWQICDGDPLKDPSSPLRKLLPGGKVPDLTHRFLRGTTPRAGELLKRDGKDTRPLGHSHAMAHGHSVNIPPQYLQNNNHRNDPRGASEYLTNAHLLGKNRDNWDSARPQVVGNTGGSTASNTAGVDSLTVETIPAYLQTYFIIRIK